MQQQQQKDVCAICLAAANPRGGGEFLTSPGCCGKWFHQSCIEDMKKAGKNFCPACIKPFPASPTFTAPTVAGPVPAPFPPSPFNNAAAYNQGTLAWGPPAQISPPQNVFSFGNTNVQPQPTATGIFARYNSASQAPPMSGSLQEDEIVATETPVKAATKSVSKGDEPKADELQINIIPEYPAEGLAAKFPFHARVSVVFSPDQTALQEQPRNGLDVVCVLDNSGSMSGSKIDNLKRAMEFVISTLTDQDRLSIVTFNSSATPLQGLWKMTEAKKDASKNIIRSIHAGGGTDIYRGMDAGWQILQQRRTRNPASCMFLLTDGQDGSNLEQKKQLARTMRAQGTSLFVFGFGNDHDSAHLLDITNAGEGSFIFIETNDTVIDAFGGAIGSQQGQLLRNIQVQFQMASPNIIIESVLAGSYPQQVDTTTRRSGHVRFADLYGGEKRDFLLQLRLPEIPSPAERYEIVSVRAQYQKYGDDTTVITTNPQTATIARVNQLAATRTRNPEVDEQVQRLEVTASIQQAVAAADRGDYKNGKENLERMKKQIESSISYTKGNPMVRGLIDDLNDCQRKISSRDEYVSFGGRAKMTETADTYSKQRAVFAKNSNMMYMQSASSVACQSSALDYRNNISSPFVATPVPAPVAAPPTAPSGSPPAVASNPATNTNPSVFSWLGGAKKK